MTIQVLEKKILDFSIENKVQAEEIINELSSYLDSISSDIDQSVSNKNLFEGLKTKIISCLYTTPDFKVVFSSETGCEEKLKIDEVELDLLNDVLIELENECNIYCVKNEIGLLDAGLETYKNYNLN